MDAEEAASHAPKDNLGEPFCDDPPTRNSDEQPGRAGRQSVALPRRRYEPHARPPGMRAGETRLADAGLTLSSSPSTSVPLGWIGGNEVHEPWYRSLPRGLRRENLPPLELTSKPVPVPSIWGMYDYRKGGLLSSTAVHVAVVVLLSSAVSQPRLPVLLPQSIDLAIPVEISRFLPTPPRDGGGGGGENSPLPPSEGPLPRFQLTQLAPPMPQELAVKPRLAVSPSLTGPADLKAKLPDLTLLGSPLDELGPPSAGPGDDGGIGSGQGSGVGQGQSSGAGDGEGLGLDGVYEVGGEVTPPVLRVQVDPEYPERARMQRLQGAVLLAIEVWPDGRAHNVRVERGLGLGLDERAVEAVKNWEFEPGTRDGEPVRVVCRVEVVFQLF
jgi:TonB family protein